MKHFRFFILLAGLAAITGCADGCKGPKGDLGPSGAQGATGPGGPGTYVKTSLWLDNFSDYSSLANWTQYLVIGGTYALTRTASVYTSPSYGADLTSSLIAAGSCYYRQIVGASGTLCASLNLNINTFSTPLNVMEFAIGNGGNIVALVGYDPNFGLKVYLNNSGTVNQLANFNNGVWNTLEMCVNLTSGKSEYRLNGTVIGTGYTTSVPVSFSGQPSTWFGFYARSNGSWTFSFDDVEAFLKS